MASRWKRLYFKSLTAAVNDQTLSNISINDHIPFWITRKIISAHIAVRLSHKASSGILKVVVLYLFGMPYFMVVSPY